jgi:Glycosyl hydrolases family 18
VKCAVFGVLAVVLFGLSPEAGSASRQLAAPRNVRLPTISGSKVVGRTLSARRGTWAGRPGRFRFTWQRCNGGRCRAVRGAHRRTYRLGRKDAASRVRVVVTASNAAGSASASSAPTRAVRGVVMDFDLGWAPTKNMPWSALTEVNVFTLETSNGPALDTHLVRRINVAARVRAAHAHGVKPFISIGGSDDQNWENACNDTNRAQFVQNLVGYATSRGFDGIDLDIEDNFWSSQNPPVAAMTTCIEAISSAAHSAGLLVSADVITNWQGPWYAPSQASVDQFNLMTYGDDLTTLQADVAATIRQGLPASKFVVGIDIIGGLQPPPGGCGQFSSYAAQAGLMGAFVWTAEADTGNVCAKGLAAGSLSLLSLVYGHVGPFPSS